ncbi:PGN_0703 family putative restriction endonuclease [Paracidobacterium acidisoli]|uniref:Uncharacterized protein n=1 Tax=Paracidobacterium acidisoli TaxID=2303751 RepID=A0A372IIZ1_9BACT|nr:hypothetical protein [Paracidobacterium acidisoli]MBT9333141.1 hypothetical protein [Paracidobacterium acidisoli]
MTSECATDRSTLTAAQLRREISTRNILRAGKFGHELSFSAQPNVIYCEWEGIHGNFLASSYRRIMANPLWKQRLMKSYTASRYVPRAADRKRYELECACSSDALLMNIFCYPKLLSSQPLCTLLGVEAGLTPEFGVHPSVPLTENRIDRTEIDMRLGHLLTEAKLTEGDFQRASVKLLSRYRDVEEVFDAALLPIRNGMVQSWQLIRGVLAAHASSGSFLVLCDRRRADLIDRWFDVMRAVSHCSLRSRLGILTWQELSAVAPKTVRLFLEEKYGIC